MADSYRWRLSGQRDRLLEDLVDVTDENTKAKALEAAVVGYLRLAGKMAWFPVKARSRSYWRPPTNVEV